MDELTAIDIEALIKKMRQVDTIETYQHFPEVITAGPFRLETAELDYLQKEAWIELCRRDTFGDIYAFTKKGKAMLSLS